MTMLLLALISAVDVTITEPVDGEEYSGDWLPVRAIVENDDTPPDSVQYSLNGGSPVPVPRLNTDWYTYMGNDDRTGFSESPAPLDDTVLWTAPVTGDTHEFCSPVVVNGIVYFVSDQQSTAYALDAATGEILWEYDVVDHVDDAVTWYQGKVYVAADSAWCLDGLTGERIWAFKPAPSLKMNGNPVLHDGIAYFSFAPDWNSMEIYALDADTGEEIWCTPLPSHASGSMTFNEGSIYMPTYYGMLYSIDAADGSIQWSNSSSGSGYWDSSPVIVEGVLYICGCDGFARGIDCSSGDTVWESYISDWYIAATPAYAYGRLFFADQVNSFHCLEGADGSPVWSVPGVQHGSSGVADSVVFFGEGADRNYGKIRALSVGTGAEIWSCQTGGNEVFSSPAITDGVVYIAGMDWNLYAFGTGLKYTYLDDLYAVVGQNELVVTSFSGGAAAAADTVSFTVTGTGINPEQPFQPRISVSPNPFVSTAYVSFDLAEPSMTTVKIYDVTGRAVAVLVDSELPAGEHTLRWNGTCGSGENAAPGLYFCRIQAGSLDGTAGLCLLRK